MSSYQLALIGTTVALVAAVEALYATRTGKAIKAVAEHREAALLRGIDPNVVSRYLFFAGGCFAALTGYLASPLLYASTTMASGLLLLGFAAAAVGGVGSSRGAPVAGIVIGVAEPPARSCCRPAINRRWCLRSRWRCCSRALKACLATRPHGRSSVSRALAAATLALVVVAVAVPLLMRAAAQCRTVRDPTGVYLIVALGLNFLTGYAGQISVGHGALVAIGAYASAIATTSGGFAFWVGALLAMAAASGLGALMALPAMRLSNWYFALITLFFAQVVADLLGEMTWLTGGFTGISGIPAPELFGRPLGDAGMYGLVVALAGLAFAGLRTLIHSRLGRAMVATRDNPLAAVASGVSLVRVRMIAFVVSAALAGLGGALYAAQKSVISTDDFGVDFSIFFCSSLSSAARVVNWGRWSAR